MIYVLKLYNSIVCDTHLWPNRVGLHEKRFYASYVSYVHKKLAYGSSTLLQHSLEHQLCYPYDPLLAYGLNSLVENNNVFG